MKLETQRDLARLILESGNVIAAAKIVEVGTGWVPLAPIGFWICGAAEVHTYDINRHLIPSVFRKALLWMANNEAELIALWDGLVSSERVSKCLRTIRQLGAEPLQLLKEARIAYYAPGDAASTGLPDASIDIHYSASVLEHVPREKIVAILREAQRVLRPEGRVAHFVDPEDHFSDSDKSITTINFLQYTDHQWTRYAGHYLAYHNRLRDGEFERLFHEADFALIAHRFEIDAQAVEALKLGFVLAPEFRRFDREQLCRRNLFFLGKQNQGFRAVD